MDNSELKKLADRVMTDRRFCSDETHRLLAAGYLALIAENGRLAKLADQYERLAIVNKSLSDSFQAERDQITNDLEQAKAQSNDVWGLAQSRADTIDQLNAENAQLKKQEIELKAESERLADLLECAQGDCRQAMQIIERVTPQAELYQQVERAAGELPSGWEIRICIELGAGYVELRDEDDCEVDFPNSCETLGMAVSDAIDAVIAKGEQS